ncbi:hypothetical protein CEXT_452251 [Caerostris extrusa]|uniref:Uncharacterized protein n=1 Tax=Caerostris extrusa TaxID=172846 RepID=A0AAV4WTX5_CAEEX|nr:hypothetical protein CEXT_452251 [Caerostris extrusa]
MEFVSCLADMEDYRHFEVKLLMLCRSIASFTEMSLRQNISNCTESGVRMCTFESAYANEFPNSSLSASFNPSSHPENPH